MSEQKSQIKSGIVLSYVYLAISMIAGLLYYAAAVCAS